MEATLYFTSNIPGAIADYEAYGWVDDTMFCCEFEALQADTSIRIDGTAYSDLLAYTWVDPDSSLRWDMAQLNSYTLYTEIYGGVGNDRIEGSWEWSDHLYGEDDDDDIYGNPRGDFLYGGAGNDHLFGGAHGDVLDGGPGNDTLSGGSGSDTLTGDAGADILVGDTGDDSLAGGDGGDILCGGPGADTLNDSDSTAETHPDVLWDSDMTGAGLTCNDSSTTINVLDSAVGCTASLTTAPGHCP